MECACVSVGLIINKHPPPPSSSCAPGPGAVFLDLKSQHKKAGGFSYSAHSNTSTSTRTRTPGRGRGRGSGGTTGSLSAVRIRASSSSSESEGRMGTVTVEKLGIKIERNPPESKLTQLGVRTWPKWGCPPSKFPWTYSAKETCYLLEGKVKVTPQGADEAVEIGAGDLVVFPKGMSCTWDVSLAVDKHYIFDD